MARSHAGWKIFAHPKMGITRKRGGKQAFIFRPSLSKKGEGFRMMKSQNKGKGRTRPYKTVRRAMRAANTWIG